jgi:peroxiredoxin Q/BCP
MTELTEGAKAPGFELAGTDGPVQLSDFAGKTLVIYFYPKDDTSGCTKEAQEFSTLSGEFAAAGAHVLGVSKDTVASHGKFTAKYDLKVALGSDPEGTMVEAYGAWVEKSMYGRKYMGLERSTYLVDKTGIIRAVWRPVSVTGHVEEVLAAAKAL